MRRRIAAGLGLGIAIVLMIGAALAAPAVASSSYGMMAWGASNSPAQLGNGPGNGSASPLGGSGLHEVTAVSAGFNYGLALLAGGGVRSWGINNYAALGDGPSTGPEKCGEAGCSSTPVAVSGLSNVTAISAGPYFALALLSNGEVMSWGDNEWGELGNGSNTGPETGCEKAQIKEKGELVSGDGACSGTPIKVSGLPGKVKAIAAGFRFSLALLQNGKVMAWGANEAGELGNGTTTSSFVPVEVSGLSGVKAIAAGANEGLALLESGKVMAWGGNAHGQLGIGKTTGPEDCAETAEEAEEPCSMTPVEVQGISNVTAIAAGDWNEIARLEDGTARTWGNNTSGQLGTGTGAISEGEITHYTPEYCPAHAAQTACSTLPLEVPGLIGVTEVSASSSGEAVLAGLSSGTVMAWGNNAVGQLGIGKSTGPEECSHTACSTRPADVDGLADVAGIAVGKEVGLAVVPAPAPPEFGRCLKVEHGHGAYGDGHCVKGEAEGGYEWYPGAMASGFTTAGGEAVLEAVGGRKVVCHSESGAGEYSPLPIGGNPAPQVVTSVVLRLSECHSAGNLCGTPAAAAGELVTKPLTGVLGVEKVSSEGAAKNKVALDLFPQSAFVEYSCIGLSTTVTGSLLVPVPTNAMSLSSSRNFKASKGKQKPEQFEGGPTDVLDESLAGLPFEQAGLTLNATQANEEKIEINSVT